MDTIKKLLEIAEYLGLRNIVSELEDISYHAKEANAHLILPLVGEFSSGKTTLINALTDGKKLETATKPTTATIYEVHFGSESCHAQILTQDGKIEEVDDMTELKNETLADAQVVTVFDTSTRVPSSTILVDTPGLSSPDQKHKQTLVNFLPKADGIMLVSDINQQITRSLTDFIETMKLSKKPLFLILTKSDTKSADDIETVKRYISKNCEIPLKQMAVVSSYSNSLDELYSLLDRIQKDKKEILRQVDGQRIKNIIDTLTSHIDELMNASQSDKNLDVAIRRSQYDLDKIHRNIEKLIESLSDEIEENERNISRKFEDIIFTRLNTLAVGKSANYDNEAISAINNTATLLMNEYKSGVQSLLCERAKNNIGTENEVPLNSLDSIDMSAIQMSGLSSNYNLDLNTMGHEYDGLIKIGLFGVAAVGTVAAVAAVAPGVAATGGLTSASLISAADTATDVGSMVETHRMRKTMKAKAIGFMSEAKDKYNSVVELDQQMGQQMNCDKGMIDSLIGPVTDKLLSKPKRVRAIRDYIENSLAPDFKIRLRGITQNIISSARRNLQNDTAALIGQKTDSLNQLKQEMKEKEEVFNQRIDKLREFKTTLLTI